MRAAADNAQLSRRLCAAPPAVTDRRAPRAAPHTAWAQRPARCHTGAGFSLTTRSTKRPQRSADRGLAPGPDSLLAGGRCPQRLAGDEGNGLPLHSLRPPLTIAARSPRRRQPPAKRLQPRPQRGHRVPRLGHSPPPALVTALGTARR